MKQQQTNGQGQGKRHSSEKHPIHAIPSDPTRDHSAKLQEVEARHAGNQQILPGGCCESSTIRRYRRKFAVFPGGGNRKNGLANKESHRQKPESPLWADSGPMMVFDFLTKQNTSIVINS